MSSATKAMYDSQDVMSDPQDVMPDLQDVMPDLFGHLEQKATRIVLMAVMVKLIILVTAP